MPPPTATRNNFVIIAPQLYIRLPISECGTFSTIRVHLAPKELSNLFRDIIKCLERKWKVWKLAESCEVLDWNKIPLARI